MAFQDFSFQGVPYHPPVAPVVPEPSDTAARTIAAGTQTGVMGFVHMAIAAKQAQLEQEQMLQRADLAAQELQYRDKWQQEDHAVAKENADTNAQYRKDWFDVYNKNAETDREYKSGLVKAKLQATADATAFQNKYAATESANDSRALNAAKNYKLDDATFWNDNPVEAIQALNDWKRRFGAAKVGAVPQMTDAFDAQVKKITVPFLAGAEYEQQLDESGKPLKDENGKQIWKWTGIGENPVPKPIPLTDILAMWNDPTQRQYVEKGMIAAGHGHIVDQIQKSTGNIVHKPYLDAYAKKILMAADKMKPSEAQSEVPPILQQSRLPQWMIKAGVGQEADAATAEAGHVKSLIQQHPELTDQLRGTFYQTYPDFDGTYFDTP